MMDVKIRSKGKRRETGPAHKSSWNTKGRSPTKFDCNPGQSSYNLVINHKPTALTSSLSNLAFTDGLRHGFGIALHTGRSISTTTFEIESIEGKQTGKTKS
jgi:hypothetical protein